MPYSNMAGVWKKYDPEVIEGYIGACSLLEKGQARVQILGDTTIRMICYGGKARVLPPLYVSDVPKEWIEKFRASRQDAVEFLAKESDQPEKFIRVYTGAATPDDVKAVAEDVLEEWDDPSTYKDEQDVSALAKWRAAAVHLKELIKGGKK